MKSAAKGIGFVLIASVLSAPGVQGAAAGTNDEIQELRRLLSEQQKQISEQQKQIDELRLMVQAQLKNNTRSVGEVVSTSSMVPPAPRAVTPSPLPAFSAEQKPESPEAAPLSFRIGSANITPVGFMDLTGIWRSTASGSGIGTNFGGVPYGNTTQGNLTELRLSAQNSRIGSRVDVKVRGAHVLAYWESDFLGYVPPNAAVSSNSDTFRLRLYWVDVRKNRWELLGGQSWSMITPGRKGISPLPADLVYSQVVDTNYHAGLTWSRDPQLRFVYHASDDAALGVSLESPEQYIGGSAGGGLITLPSALATPYASQLNNGGTALSAPGFHPDVVAKIAFDPKLPNGRGFHFELGGTVRTFKVYNPLNNQTFTARGGGGQVNLYVELFKGFRALTNNYWSKGGGRWIFGQAPDLIVRSDGSLSPVQASSTVSGFEFIRNNVLLYAYYGGVYIGRNVAIDSATGKFAGYGYPGSPNGQNRTIQEGTFGFTQTFWKDAKFGALSLMGQYSYVIRNPWAVAADQPKNAKLNMVYLNLRYALPGSAPAAK
jgi:hypothetical protein